MEAGLGSQKRKLRAGCSQRGDQLDMDLGGAWNRSDVMGECTRKREELMRLCAGCDADAFHLSGEEAALESEFRRGDRPLRAGFDLDRLELNRGKRRGQ